MIVGKVVIICLTCLQLYLSLWLCGPGVIANLTTKPELSR
jgi:hypothetical protein